MSAYSFPQGFAWGAATSSYQIEGAVNEDGRGQSIWDTLCRRPGAITNADHGEIACDHYHRWPQDLDLIKELGIGHYRFSIAWPRILPSGTGAVNLKGLDFYKRLVDGMLERGIVPFATLYHWDLPQALEDRGGWRSRDTAKAFADYASVVASALGDRVKYWATFNEMPCVVDLGHRTGEHAPGAREPEQVIRQVNHHVLLAHGLGVKAVRAVSDDASIGFVHNVDAPQPVIESDEDIAIARSGFLRRNAWMLDAAFLGRYPEDQWNELGHDVPRVEAGDAATIAQPLDFFGINAYSSYLYGSIERGLEVPEAHFPRTPMDWPIMGDCLYWGSRFCHERYHPRSIYITENGCAWPDSPEPGGDAVVDYSRLEYLRCHLKGVHRAIGEGIPVKGFFVWSLMDNFEWAHGYTKRFGITHVDFKTQRRTPKLSARWYSRVIGRSAL